MRIPSDQIPQADNLDDVIEVVRAVGRGDESYQELARAIRKTERQGRYYRRAAEILGFITNERNRSRLTALGKRYLDSEGINQDEMLLGAVVSNPLFGRVLRLFEGSDLSLSHEQIADFLTEVAELTAPSMGPRRASTVISWLLYLGLIREEGGQYLLVPDRVGAVPAVEVASLYEPLIPDPQNLSTYETVEQRHRQAQGIMEISVDLVARERANEAHRGLVDLVADKIRAVDAIPKYNSLVDLAARIRDEPFIFEMKSLTTENARSQIRAGLSQLYEYRYLQAQPSARLVLVVETALPERLLWMSDYLEEDRGICLLWDGDRTLHGSRLSRAIVPDLFRD